MSVNNNENVPEIVPWTVKSGGQIGNSNAVKHGLYQVKSKDPNKAQRERRRVNRKLAGVASELRPVMRPVTQRIVRVEAMLELMEKHIADVGVENATRMLTEWNRTNTTWLNLLKENGMTLASYMATRKDSIHGDIMALKRWAEGES